MTYTAISVLAGFLAVVPMSTWAAKAPLSAEELATEASHIVSGRVVDVTAKTQKSKVEKAWGLHRDRVFMITLKVDTMLKGAGVNAGDAIQVVAWRPVWRIPPLPGLQGHESIPEKGNTVTVYLKGKDGNAFKPILPNGIVIERDTGQGERPAVEDVSGASK